MDRRSRERARTELLRLAASDAQFRAALLEEPRAAIKSAFGFDVPPELDVQVVEETDGRMYVVLPPPPPSSDAEVTLRDVTKDTVGAICSLEVRPDQKHLVAPNAVSIAQAHFAPTAWFREIYANDTPVGFVMLSDDAEQRNYYVWRFMIAGEYQKLGFGRRAMELVIEYVRSRPGAHELTLSYVPGEGSPRDFYRSLGFEDTGEVHGGENVMRLALAP